MQQIAAQHQSDMELERLKLENQLAIAEIETNNQNIQERLAAVEDMFKQFHVQSHELGLQKDQQAHERAITAQQAAHQQDAQAQQADAQSQQSAQDAAQAQMAQQQAQTEGAAQ
jgi:hypothetical protein